MKLLDRSSDPSNQGAPDRGDAALAMAPPIALFIEMNTSGSGMEFAAKARQLGLAPVVLSAAPEQYAFLSGYGDLPFQLCDTSSAGEIERSCAELTKRSGIALVASSSDHFLHAAAVLARKLGLRGASPEAIALCRDKARQVEVLARGGVAVPLRSVAVSRMEEARPAIASVGLPAVVKPAAGTGSIGVRRVETEQEALAAISSLLARTTNERGLPADPRCLVMAYIEGEEFSVEFLDGQTIGVTKKHLGPLPHFVEIGHDFPAPIDTVLKHNLMATARRALEVIGHLRGAAHVELRANAGGVFVIEINPRLAGGQIPRLIRLATGFDPVNAILTSLLDGRADIDMPARLHGSLRFIVPARNGSIARFKGFDEAAARFGLADIALYRRLPIQFERANDFRDRVGHVIATDERSEAAQRRASAAAKFFADQTDQDVLP